MIDRRTVWLLGFGQLISWGVTYYLVGVMGPRMAADLGWSLTAVNGGFSAALLVMGLASPLAGKLVEARGGRGAMTAGALIGAAGCAGLSLAHSAPAYYAAWIVIGVSMRLTLYDAAFAALARIAGPSAKRAMAQITLLGGFASTALWPIGDALADAFGWRAAVLAYAAISAASALLYRTLPDGRYAPDAAPADDLAADVVDTQDATRKRLAAVLYAVAVAMVGALNSAMSAHMIGILAGLGLALQSAVWISTLRGFGQTGARGCEVLFGGQLRAVDLNLFASVVLAGCFLVGLFSGASLAAAIGFVLLFGAGNGLSTITRGTLPLVFFDPATYGSLVGRLIMPSFLAQAAAPVGYAFVIDAYGAGAALWLSFALGAGALAAALGLKMLAGRR